MDNDEEIATLDGQFVAFAKFLESGRDGTTINLHSSDYWLRQSKVLDDRNLTMTDTGLAWMKFDKTELSYEEWYEFLTHICISKDMDQVEVEEQLTCCGLPGSVPVIIPQYKIFFDTYEPKDKLKY